MVGTAGSGKTTVGRQLAAKLGLPFVELDAIHWYRPGWVARDRASFRAEVEARTSGEAWVVDGNYTSNVQDIVWSWADTVLWLDLPRGAVMRQIVGRTLGRVLLRRELWSGNRERLRNLLTTNPEESVIAWSWQQHGRKRRQYEAAMDDPRWRHIHFIRLRSRREVRQLLASLPE